MAPDPNPAFDQARLAALEAHVRRLDEELSRARLALGVLLPLILDQHAAPLRLEVLQ